MPKRSIEDKIDRYHKKIRKLERKVCYKEHNQVFNSSDSDNENNEADIISTYNQETEANASLPADIVTEALETPAAADTPKEPELPADILLALGEAVNDAPEFGDDIHNNLAQRWLPILKKGISKQVKDDLFKEYRIPANCALIQAPKLNPELSAAVTDMARNRDKKMEQSQQQLGVGITAINRAMSLLITGDDKIQAIKMLSDGCRILTDLHFMDTQARIKMLVPGLDKSFVNVIKDSERDNMLFGTSLPEKIKATKAIEKQGLQIKKPTHTTKLPASSSSTSAPRPRYQENWAGPPRYQSNRGGRGGMRRHLPAMRKTAPGLQGKTLNPNKARPLPPPPQQ